MSPRAIIPLFIAALAASAVLPAAAQIKPASSGARSFNAPEMRRYGSGFYRPNQPGQGDPSPADHPAHRQDGPYER